MGSNNFLPPPKLPLSQKCSWSNFRVRSFGVKSLGVFREQPLVKRLTGGAERSLVTTGYSERAGYPKDILPVPARDLIYVHLRHAETLKPH